MAVSKRLRYEILRRDNHTCRYCGGSAPDVVLTVDHVVPTALGGGDDPTNLVAACKDCNAGKTSTSPDAPLVADVSEDAKRWHARIKYAMDQIENDLIEKNIHRGEFERLWGGYAVKGQPLPMPLDWRGTVDHWIALKVPHVVLAEAIQIAMGKQNVAHDARWKYMCGVVWRTIDKAQLQAEATEATEEEEKAEEAWFEDARERAEQYGWTLAYDMFAYNDKVNRCLVDLVDGRRSDYLRWVA
jgi:hypothetical protein